MTHPESPWTAPRADAAVLAPARAWWARLTGPRRSEPSYPVLPVVDERGETSVPGVFAIGELAGEPLVRLGLNAGHRLAATLASELGTAPRAGEGVFDVVVVGSGSSGFALAVAAKDLGLSVVVVEAARFANTFVTMTRGKVLFAEPLDVPLVSRVWFEECTREELLERWQAMREREGIDVREHTRVTGISGSKGDFEVQTSAGPLRARCVALCMGKAGNPRTLGVPGEREHADRLAHRLSDPDAFVDRDIVCVGAGDVSFEAAIALAGDGRNRVTITCIDTTLTFPKKRNRDRVLDLVAQGRVRLELGTTVERFEAGEAVIRRPDGQEVRAKADAIFEMIGSELPVAFLRKAGVRLNTDWPWQRWVGLAALGLAVWALYALKSYGKDWTGAPFNTWIAPSTYDAALLALFRPAFAPFAWLFQEEALAQILADRGFQQGYLYSGAYTLILLGFGYQALMRWRSVATDPRYQTWRYASLVSFQVGFFLLVNVFGVFALGTRYSWRLWGLYQPFPLFFNTFFWWYDDPAWIVAGFAVAGLLGTFVAIPWAARNHGKRFCTWICGCGGLAETLGDRWRHLAPKGARSRAWEFQGSVVAVAAFLVGAVVVGAYETHGDNWWWYAYNYVVDFWLVAVIPIALYPFFGGKVWCRYWCPLAAYNGWLAARYGRLKIVSDEGCISCTRCSTYCQVGVDVMAFAKDGLPFDNSNSSCIQCGICIDVCPMDVLSFETSDGLAARA